MKLIGEIPRNQYERIRVVENEYKGHDLVDVESIHIG